MGYTYKPNLGAALGNVLPTAFNNFQNMVAFNQQYKANEQNMAINAQNADQTYRMNEQNMNLRNQTAQQNAELFNSQQPTRDLNAAMDRTKLDMWQKEIARKNKPIDLNALPKDNIALNALMGVAQDTGYLRPDKVPTVGDLEDFQAHLNDNPMLIKQRFTDAYTEISSKIQSMAAPIQATKDKLAQLQAEYATADTLTQEKIKGQMDKLQQSLASAQAQLAPLQQQNQYILQTLGQSETKSQLDTFLSDNADALSSLTPEQKSVAVLYAQNGDVKGLSDYLSKVTTAKSNTAYKPGQLLHYESNGMKITEIVQPDGTTVIKAKSPVKVAGSGNAAPKDNTGKFMKAVKDSLTNRGEMFKNFDGSVVIKPTNQTYDLIDRFANKYGVDMNEGLAMFGLPTKEDVIAAATGGGTLADAVNAKGAPAAPAAVSDQPPVAGAQKADDGKWYVQKNGKWYRVD